MFDHDTDKRRGAGLTAFNPLAEPKARKPVSPAYLEAFEFLLRMDAYTSKPRGVGKRTQALLASGCLNIREINRRGLDSVLTDPVMPPQCPTGATGCLSPPEYPKGHYAVD